MIVLIDLLQCKTCGKKALGFPTKRITAHKCIGDWSVVHVFRAEFDQNDLTRAVDESVGEEYLKQMKKIKVPIG